MCRVTSLTGCEFSSSFLSLGWIGELGVRFGKLLTRMNFFCRHVDLKGNLVKAMMVLNWLNMLEVEKF